MATAPHRHERSGRARQPEQQKAPSSLRCVAARISSGPFLPTTSTPRPGLPQVLGLGCGLRCAHLPGVVPFGSCTAPDPSRPSSGSPDPRARRFRHQTGVHRFQHRKDARSRLQEGIRGISRVPSGRWSTCPRTLRSDGRRRARRDPAALGAEIGERRGGRRGVAEPEATRAPRPREHAARASTKGCRSRGADRSATRGSRPTASPSSAARCRDSRATRTTSQDACASPCCTRSVITSACPTRACTSSVGRSGETRRGAGAVVGSPHAVPRQPDPGRRDGRPRPPSALVVLLAQHPHRHPPGDHPHRGAQRRRRLDLEVRRHPRRCSSLSPGRCGWG